MGGALCKELEISFFTHKSCVDALQKKTWWHDDMMSPRPDVISCLDMYIVVVYDVTSGLNVKNVSTKYWMVYTMCHLNIEWFRPGLDQV